MSKAEEYIIEHTSVLKDSNGKEYFKWLTPYQAKEAVEIAREEELEYVKYQLELRLPETLDYNGVKIERKDFIENFIKAIEDD